MAYCDIELDFGFASELNIFSSCIQYSMLYLIWLKYFVSSNVKRGKKNQICIYEGRFNSKNIIKFAFAVSMLRFDSMRCVAWEYHLLSTCYIFHRHPHTIFFCCFLSFLISFPFLIFIQQKCGQQYFFFHRKFWSVYFSMCFKSKISMNLAAHRNMKLSSYQDLFAASL